MCLITISSVLQQVGPGDAWKFRHVVFIVISVGAAASIIFHAVVREKQPYRTQQELDRQGNNVHCEILKRPVMYQVCYINIYIFYNFP